MKHIFETTIRGLITHYSKYNTNDSLSVMDNGDITIDAENPEYFMRIVSNVDTFVLSFFLGYGDLPYVSVYFCDGSISLKHEGSYELHPYSVGGYWSVRDIFNALDEIFRRQECTCPVYDALFLLADNVDKAVVNELKSITSQFSEHRIENPHGAGCDVVFAVPGTPNNANHLLKIIGGDEVGVYRLEFGIGVYFIGTPPTIQHMMNYDVSFEYTGVLYTDIRNALVKIIKNARITTIDSDGDNNFTTASPKDVIEMLVPQCMDVEADVVKPSPSDNGGGYDIITDFANRVMTLERFDISMYLKHQCGDEVVVFSKVNDSRNIEGLPIFRLTIQDGIVIVKFNFYNPDCVVTIYMLPGYQGDMLDKVTIVLQDEIMFKRGVCTINGITRDVTGIMNGALVALGHAFGPQYGRFDKHVTNIDPMFKSLVRDLELEGKVIYPVT